MEISLGLVLQGVFMGTFQEIVTGGLCMPGVPLLFFHDFEGQKIEFWEEHHSQIALLWLIIESPKIFWDFGKTCCISTLGFHLESCISCTITHHIRVLRMGVEGLNSPLQSDCMFKKSFLLDYTRNLHGNVFRVTSTSREFMSQGQVVNCASQNHF